MILSLFLACTQGKPLGDAETGRPPSDTGGGATWAGRLPLPAPISFKPDETGASAGPATLLDPSLASLIVTDHIDIVTDLGLEPSRALLQRQHGEARITDVEQSAEAWGATYFFPGHWAYGASASASGAELGAGERVAVATSGASLQSGAVVVLHAPGDWSAAETAVVEASAGGALTLLRGARLPCTAWLADPIDWSDVSTVVLSPHLGLFATLDSSSGEARCADLSGAYTFNLSPDAPRRTDGARADTAAELYGRYQIHHLARMSGLLTFADLESPDHDLLADLGPLELLVGGVEFDTGLWSVDGLDVDNDGDEDDGYVDGYQRWGRGAMLAMAELRAYADEVLSEPDQFQLLVDSDSPRSFRGYESVSGIEMEHFPSLESPTPADRLSEGLGHLRAAVDGVSAAGREPLSYAFTKQPTAAVECEATEPSGAYDDRGFRLGAAASTLLLQPHAYASFGPGRCFGLYDWDEYAGGSGEPSAWLGEALSAEPIQAPDLGADVPLTWSAEATRCAGDTKGAPVTTSGLSLPVTLYPGESGCLGDTDATAPDPSDTLLVGNLDTATLSSSWTVRLSLTATTTTSGGATPFTEPLSTLAPPPRRVVVELYTATHVYTQSALVPQGDDDAQIVSLSFLSEGLSVEAVSSVRIGLGDEPGEVTVAEASLRPGSAERWARVFEHGVVLLNGSPDAWTVEASLLPGAPAGLRRLEGVIAPDVNNGEPADVVTVPPLDALFLRADGG